MTAGLHAKLIQHPKDAAAFEEFRGHSALPKVMLFTDKAKSTVQTCLPLCCPHRRGTSLAASRHILQQPEQHAALQPLQHQQISGTTKSTAIGFKKGRMLCLMQPLFKSLSMRFRDRLAFAEVRDVKGAIAGMLDVTASPTLLVVPAEGEPIKYDGESDAISGAF